MPSLKSLNSYKIGQTHIFKVFGNAGDDLSHCTLDEVKTTSPHLGWSNWSLQGNPQKFLNIKADLGSTKKERDRDVVGDLTVTVTDHPSGVQVVGTFTVVYEP